MRLYSPEEAVTPEELVASRNDVRRDERQVTSGRTANPATKERRRMWACLGLEFDPNTNCPGLKVAESASRNSGFRCDTNQCRRMGYENGPGGRCPHRSIISSFSTIRAIEPRAGPSAKDLNGKDSRKVTLTPLPFSGGNPLEANWYDADVQGMEESATGKKWTKCREEKSGTSISSRWIRRRWMNSHVNC